MIDNDEGFPTGADDKSFYAISPCLCCPECGNPELEKRPNDCDDDLWECWCWDCGASWYERHWNDDEESEG